MNYNIRSRLQAVEDVKKNESVPDIVMIIQNDSGAYIAQETYSKKDAKGKVIPKRGKIKRIPLERPEDYKPPKGFNGVILTGEGDLKDV